MSISSDITRIKGAKDDLKTAINAKGGTLTTELIDEYPAAVDAIPTGTDTSSATATASDILTGKTAYISDGTEATGTCDFNADTTDATATADSLLYGHTAYGAAGTKLTGTGANWQYVTQLGYLCYGAVLPSIFTIYAPNVISLLSAFMTASGVTTLTLTIGTITSTAASGLYQAFRNCASMVTLNLTANTSNATTLASTFRDCASLQTINITLDLSSVTEAGSWLSNCVELVTISFAVSTIKISISFAACSLLSTASLLSIANGLHQPSAPKTLTMHPTSKTNMDNIMVDVVDGVAVLGTTKTLTQFITTDKGWTIACLHQ